MATCEIYETVGRKMVKKRYSGSSIQGWPPNVVGESREGGVRCGEMGEVGNKETIKRKNKKKR